MQCSNNTIPIPSRPRFLILRKQEYRTISSQISPRRNVPQSSPVISSVSHRKHPLVAAQACRRQAHLEAATRDMGHGTQNITGFLNSTDKHSMYPVVMTNIAIEHGHLSWISPLNMFFFFP